MQFSTIIVALFAGVALAAPAIEARQTTICDLCAKECFDSKSPDPVFRKCIDRCNKDIGCNKTP
ncbi:hypothetical protein CTA2_7694 [Colletotrichum tanaceti]|uniref:Extracellular membrane protein CFEM domain-containing protein n=1 Tax=Colletotrichum tanaceti TaxID=1306861 RepID=A0A4U6XEP1_9PEZI|nr:hypothetical protein CTA2_7694 [Colletotrichum tanaceti]TKW52377.1 hypothetical protein CTA1_3661 [Colletotrichum tanaceti]